jgi:hypothetical protein
MVVVVVVVHLFPARSRSRSLFRKKERKKEERVDRIQRVGEGERESKEFS